MSLSLSVVILSQACMEGCPCGAESLGVLVGEVSELPLLEIVGIVLTRCYRGKVSEPVKQLCRSLL